MKLAAQVVRFDPHAASKVEISALEAAWHETRLRFGRATTNTSKQSDAHYP